MHTASYLEESTPVGAPVADPAIDDADSLDHFVAAVVCPDAVVKLTTEQHMSGPSHAEDSSVTLRVLTPDGGAECLDLDVGDVAGTAFLLLNAIAAAHGNGVDSATADLQATIDVLEDRSHKLAALANPLRDRLKPGDAAPEMSVDVSVALMEEKISAGRMAPAFGSPAFPGAESLRLGPSLAPFMVPEEEAAPLPAKA